MSRDTDMCLFYINLGAWRCKEHLPSIGPRSPSVFWWLEYCLSETKSPTPVKQQPVTPLCVNSVESLCNVVCFSLRLSLHLLCDVPVACVLRVHENTFFALSMRLLIPPAMFLKIAPRRSLDVPTLYGNFFRKSANVLSGILNCENNGIRSFHDASNLAHLCFCSLQITRMSRSSTTKSKIWRNASKGLRQQQLTWTIRKWLACCCLLCLHSGCDFQL